MSLPVQPWEKLLIDLGVPFRVEFLLQPPLTPEEKEKILGAHGERAREIVLRRYGLAGGGPQSFGEIAAERGQSRQYIQKTEKQWRKKARAILGITPEEE